MKGFIHRLEISSTDMNSISKLELTDPPEYDFKVYPWVKVHLEYVRDEINKILEDK